MSQVYNMLLRGTLGRSRRGSFFLASMCTTLPFRVSSTASTTLSIWVTPACANMTALNQEMHLQCTLVMTR